MHKKKSPEQQAVNLCSCIKEEGGEKRENNPCHFSEAGMEVRHMMNKKPHGRKGSFSQSARGGVIRF